MLPASVTQTIADRFGPVTGARSVGGGCINEAAELHAGGRLLFVKWNGGALPSMFECEARGLALLREAATIRVPEPLLWREASADRPALLVMEHFGDGRPVGDFAERLGRGLAALHRMTGPTHGLDHDNYIGSLPQENRPSESWLEFFSERRIGAQADLARAAGRLPGAVSRGLDRLLARLGDLLPDAVEPSLLHGDLWSGNYGVAGDGSPVMFDPAVYRGHREVELAFTELFGGFPRGFYTAYGSAWPLDPGYDERRDVYNLYPLLVHVNLFGGAYVSQVASIVRRFS